SVNDMLAYADWTGLRPLSEMEYEKMARRPYPSAPGLKDWAGGKEASLILPAGENYSSGSAGRFDERLINANINAGGKTSGPVRVGSFAKGASNPTEAGASYWGLMDLSGNLAEIYYNVNTYGRIFSDDVRGRNHGDGYLDATGMNNVAIGYWPIAQVGAFGLRGGSFMSEKAGESEGEVSVADRSKMRCFSSLDSRDSTVSFRLGHSCTKLIEQYPASYSSYIQLENGKMSTSTNQFDSVCVNTLYTIKGSELLDASSNPITFSGKIQYIWYMSEVSASAGWRIIPGANNRDLTYSDWRDESNTVREVWIKRVIMTPIGAHTTNHVILRIVNDHFSINRLVDTIKDNNQVLAFSARTALPATYTWRWKSAEPGSPALQTNPLTTHSYYFSKREDFNNISKQNHVVQCQIKVLNKCVKNVEVKVYVEPRLEVGIASSDIVMNGTNPKKECGVMMQDTRDGKVYGTVRIGDQCWMAENLRYELIGNIQYQAGDPSGEKYGIMYVSNAVVYNNACPAGWRMALNTDFETLRTYLKDGKNTEGLKLRAGNYWAMAGQADANFGTNTSGFGAVGAGHNNASAGLHTYAYFITSNGNYYSVHYANQAFSGPTGTSGSHYMSIRCIKR
ncbi:hypothetical protein LJC62_01805, partial [Odoribacter sp. OttesenSCG-928-A06]|nr:hypothetical protein [Odoribacter sp. OttesenSCG-928-A06]